MVEVLDAEYETVEQAAKAALKQAAFLFANREFLTVAAASQEGDPYLFGLYFSEADAKKGAEAWQAAGFRCYPMRVHDNVHIEARYRGIPIPGDCECGHDATLHKMAGGSGDARNGRQWCAKCGQLNCRKFKAKDWPDPTPIIYGEETT